MNDKAKQSLNLASRHLRAIGHPLRLTVLCHLVAGPKNVSELLEVTKVTQPNLSQHLAKLRMIGILNSKREGQNVYYSLADPALIQIIDTIQTVFNLEAIEETATNIRLAKG